MNYIIKRVGQVFITIWAVITLTFAMIRLIPGGPMDFIRAQLMQQNPGQDREAINRIAQAYTNINPDQPLYIAYYEYMAAMLTGDMGRSFYYGRPVSEIIANALPWTLFIMSLGGLMVFGIGIVLGSLLGYYEGTRFDKSGTIVGILMDSIPFYVMGILLLIFFGYRRDWFPRGGAYSSRTVDPGLHMEFIVNIVHHAALPSLSYGLTAFGMIALLMRGNCISVLGSDFMRVAELRGLPERKIALGYLGRNAILPMYTELLIAIAFMIGGSVILEEIFSYPGIGLRMLNGIYARDTPLMMGTFIIVTVAVAIGMFVADLTYGKIDPRIKVGESE